MIETLIRDEATPISGAIEGGQGAAPSPYATWLVWSYHAQKEIRDPALMGAWLNQLGPDDLRFIRAGQILPPVAPGPTGGAGAIKRVQELYETIERVDLADDLRAAYIPGPMADWMAQHWPAWAIPRRTGARLYAAWAWVEDRVRGWL